jgi:Pheromone A receptor
VIAAGSVAIPGACLCIQRRIYHVLSDPLDSAAVTIAQVRISGLLWHLCSDNEFFYKKRRRLILDLFICLGFPLLYLVFGTFMLSTTSMDFDTFW